MPTKISQEDSRTPPGFAVIVVHHRPHQRSHVSWPSVLLCHYQFPDHILLHRQAHVIKVVPQKAFSEASTNVLNSTDLDINTC